MNITEFLHKFIEKFVPMDINASNDLQLNANDWYGKIEDEIKHIELANKEIAAENDANLGKEDYQPKALKKLQLKHRIVQLMSMWYMRYAIAILFIILVPKVKAYINGENNKPIDDDDDYVEDDDDNDYADFVAYQKFKRSRK